MSTTLLTYTGCVCVVSLMRTAHANTFRCHCHTLDLVVTTDTTSLSDLDVCDTQQLSDHRCIDFDLPYPVIQKEIHTVTTQNWPNFDIADFVNELAISELATTASDDVNYLFSLY